MIDLALPARGTLAALLASLLLQAADMREDSIQALVFDDGRLRDVPDFVIAIHSA
jgi:hypothetical protein